MEVKDIATIFKGPLDKLLSFIGNELQQTFSSRFLEYQVEEYKRNFYSKTMIYRTEPKALSEFYQPLYISKKTLFKYKKDRIDTSSVSKLFNNNKYITIIGNAGSGKSTIVKYLFTNCIVEKYKIPIKIELRYLNEYQGSLVDYIYNEIFHFFKLGFSPQITERLLGTGDFIFFFDGYDELNSSIKSQTTLDIDNFIKKFPDNKYMLTSRPYTNVDLLGLFVNFQVCDLSEDDISAFVYKQIASTENELAEKIISAINKIENQSYNSFLKNPLLLSMFILTFQSYADVPERRTEFYSQVFDTLYSMHDSVSKLAFVREKTSGLSKDQFEDVLQLFSFLSFFEQRFIFSSNYLNNILGIIKSKRSHLKFDNDKIINDLQIAIAILNKEGIDYTFPHRSLQEYFAALYISKLSQENKEAMYAKLKDDIEGEIYELLDREHFYSLLKELDPLNLSIYVSIPLLENIYFTLNNRFRLTNSTGYHFYGRILIIMFILLKNEMREIDIDIIDNSAAYSTGLKENIRKKKLTEEELENLEKMKKKVTYFKKNGRQIIDTLRRVIHDSEKADSEIINLLK